MASGIRWPAREPHSYLSPTLHLSVLASSHLANEPSISSRVAVSTDSCIFLHAEIEVNSRVLICESTTMFSQGRGHGGLASESRGPWLHVSNRQKISRKWHVAISNPGPSTTWDPAADVTPNCGMARGNVAAFDRYSSYFLLYLDSLWSSQVLGETLK